MPVLQDAANRLGQGKGAVVSVGATAGTCESRLVHEFKKILGLKKCKWVDGSVRPYGRGAFVAIGPNSRVVIQDQLAGNRIEADIPDRGVY